MADGMIGTSLRLGLIVAPGAPGDAARRHPPRLAGLRLAAVLLPLLGLLLAGWQALGAARQEVGARAQNVLDTPVPVAEAGLGATWLGLMALPVAAALAATVLLRWAARRTECALARCAAAEAEARRMERQATLGLLAGGLAHDFGNISQSVLAAAHLLRRHAGDEARVRMLAGLLLGEAQRAAVLSRRMLAATGAEAVRDRARMPPVEVTSALEAMYGLLAATLGPGIRLALEPGAALRGQGFTRSELETAVLNLAANAREAMPGGGTVRIRAERVARGAPLALPAGLARRDWLRIAVADGGRGMDAATLRRLGEAFFTTKPEGAGLGLGLAMVAALARAAGGTLQAESTPGRGSTVTLWLPAA